MTPDLSVLLNQGYPDGPALLYVHSDRPLDGSRTVTVVDQSVPGGPLPDGAVLLPSAIRERRILRALLEQALWLLEQDGPK